MRKYASKRHKSLWKKMAFTCAALLIVAILIFSGINIAIPTSAVSNDVIYVSDDGSDSAAGDSPINAKKTLPAAISALPDTGGTVVLCGDVTINAVAPVFAAKTGKVTVTGKYGSVEYNPTIKLTTSKNMYMQFLSEIEFNNLTFNRIGSAWCEFTTGPKLIFGEGLEFLDNSGAMSYDGTCMMVRLGYSDAHSTYDKKCDSAYFEMHSGTLNYVHGGNKWNDVGAATIKMYGPATVTDHVQCGGTNFGVDSVNLTLDGVTIPELYVGGYGGSASQAPTTNNVTVLAVDSSIGKMLNTRQVYGSSSSTAYYGKLAGNVNITLDNTGVGTIDMSHGTIVDTANISLTFQNQDSFTVSDSLNWVDSLNLTDSSFVYVNTKYAGPPSSVTVDSSSMLMLSNTHNEAANVPVNATIAHNYVMTMGENGSYTLTCTDEKCGTSTVTKTTGELNVVYLDGTATVCGDGSLPSNPVNSLTAAYTRLKNEGGTIVVMGGFAVESSKGATVEWPTKTGKVTITGKYQGVDYSGKITFNGSATFAVQFPNPIEFRHLTFDRTGSGYTQFASGPDLTFGENMVMTRGGSSFAASTNTFVVRCGYAATPPADQTASFTMHSGTLNFVQGGNSWRDAGSATIYIGGTAKVLTHVQAGGTPYHVNGNVNITIDGASVAELYLGGYSSSKISGNVTVTVKNVTNLAVAGQRTPSGSAYGIGGNLSVSVENSTLRTFSLTEIKRVNGDVTIELEDTTVSSMMHLGGNGVTLSGDLTFTADNCTINAVSANYAVGGNLIASLKDTNISSDLYLGGNTSGNVTVTLDKTYTGSDLQHVQDANATGTVSLTLKNYENFSSGNSFSTVDALTLENSIIMMSTKYEGPEIIAVSDGSILYINGSMNAEADMPANSLTGTGKIIYLNDSTFDDGDPITMRYDDRLDVSKYSQILILDKGTPTSYQVGYGITANTVQDTAVVSYNPVTKKLVATGIGTATVVLGDERITVTVEPAPISLFLLIGQSNMAGSDGDKNKSIITEAGQVYSTFGAQEASWVSNFGLGGMQGLTVSTAPNFVASALAGPGSYVNRNGNSTNLNVYPLDALSANGPGKMGMDSGLGYEWTKLTGEKIWMVNAAHGATSITSWVPGGSEYLQAKAIFQAAQATLADEIAAGHYTLSHMGYFWCQGCADRVQTADWYIKNFTAMHEQLKQDLGYDFGGTTGKRTLESANLILVRACGTDGANSQNDIKEKEWHTYKDLEMTGVRVAQYYMTNSNKDAFKDVHMVSNLGDSFVFWDDAKTKSDVKEIFEARYPDGLDYTTHVGVLEMPTKETDVHRTIHYSQLGFNEVGREAARNMFYRLNPQKQPNENVSIKLYAWDGYTDLAGKTDTEILTEAQTVVPVVYPLYRAKEMTVTGLDHGYYELTGTRAGTVTATLGETTVVYKLNPTDSLKTFRWELGNGTFATVSGEGLTENALKLLQGSINTDGTLNGASFRLSESVVLFHDQPWSIEWKGAVASPSGGAFFLLASSCSSNTLDAPQIIVSSHSVIISRRLEDGNNGGYANNFFDHYRSSASIDLANDHTYVLVNKVSQDSNMVYLYIDNVEIGPLDENYHDGTLIGQSSWVSGKDFVLSHIGAKSAGSKMTTNTDANYNSYNHTLTGTLEYLQVSENRLKKTDAVEATCTEGGNTAYYTDPITGKYYSDEQGKNEIAENSWKTPADGHDLTETKASGATCTEGGNTAYWTCGTCDKHFSDADGENEIAADSWKIPADGHDFTETKASDATCTEGGNSAYWTCETCGKHFSDADGENEIAVDSWKIPAEGHDLTETKASDATCTEGGNTAYWTCGTCSKHFSDAEGKTEIAVDSWKTPADGHDLTETKASDATCTEGGNSAYWTCETCGKHFSDADGENEIAADSWKIPADGHDLTKVDRVEPTKTEDGNIEHWACGSCNKFYADAEGTQEITESETILTASPDSGDRTMLVPAALISVMSLLGAALLITKKRFF